MIRGILSSLFSLLKLLSFSITSYNIKLCFCIALGSTVRGVQLEGKEHVNIEQRERGKIMKRAND